MPLFVPLTDAALKELRVVARRERRRPQEQAAVLIERALTAERKSLCPADLAPSAGDRRSAADE